MIQDKAGSRRARGSIDELPSGSYRVRVHGGVDPLTGRRRDLTETATTYAEAKRARTRLQNQVDERRSPRTRATVDQLLDRWLEVLDVEVSTRRGYVIKLDKHVRPVLGRLQVAKLDSEALDGFYAILRKCREHCGGRRYVEHRTSRPHDCDAKCGPHICRGLSDSSVRQVHWILSGALDRAIRWKWIAVNPADHADKPPLPHPDPQPPSPTDAATILTAAWSDPAWGTFLWLAMTTGARRGELCALRWDRVDLSAGLVRFDRSLYLDQGRWRDKDTKTHQARRIALDVDTVAVLGEHAERCRDRAQMLGVKLAEDGYVFSLDPDGGEPLSPDTATQRYGRLVKRLGLGGHLHQLRHYSATELLASGVDLRTIAGRLGHGGGGATTLRVNAAWRDESDHRAASAIAGRLPRSQS